MMTTSETPEAAEFASRRKRGLLIDFGYATKLTSTGDVDDTDRTVSRPILFPYPLTQPLGHCPFHGHPNSKHHNPYLSQC